MDDLILSILDPVCAVGLVRTLREIWTWIRTGSQAVFMSHPFLVTVTSAIPVDGPETLQANIAHTLHSTNGSLALNRAHFVSTPLKINVRSHSSVG